MDGKTVLLTGGTGSFGSKFVPLTLRNQNPEKIIVLSRDEMKQWSMAQHYKDENRLRFFIGDVRDKERLYRAFEGVDVVVHAAATKIVPTAEYNPFEAVKTNVLGAMNVIDAALDRGVERVVALSTDKASSPVNLYGATKMTSDKLFIAANSYAGKKNTRFSVVRYGNVMGSRGSVIPFFLSLPDGSVLPITDERMTRFMISLDQGVKLVWKALQEAQGGEIFVQKIPSMNILEIAEAVRPDLKRKVVGMRPGEKLHEQMISAEDSVTTVDCGDHYRIFPSIDLGHEVDVNESWKKVEIGFNYSSDNNPSWMTIDQLQQWLEANKASIGKY
ncbi:UDP-N-acetylglucosamine 4,6-dehydratase (inverting) [Aquiluna borgnonia]|uniref:UDP-N-acetylglucosamine 4,6-dehydratase (Inverting) n=1 Tax=Aquiluna borgnonia TaxID=2499157 RepID=A0A7D4TL88_9MICO|nr:UDP-N-acetylglucosamine 4,6-dehydratase (inverting) [Aquiluna borgnonia]